VRGIALDVTDVTAARVRRTTLVTAVALPCWTIDPDASGAEAADGAAGRGGTDSRSQGKSGRSSRGLASSSSSRLRSVPVTEERSDEDLMRAYVDGDERAFEELFRRYAPIVLGMVRRALRDEELAREITQHTFFRLHGARGDFHQGSRVRPWLLTIAMNLVREHWRRQKRRPHVDLDLDTRAAPTPEKSALELEQRSEAVHAALAKLPSSQREVVELHYFEERPYKEVAEILGTSEGAVRVRAHRAYTTLKALLAEAFR
jgi:RNA polymerase sigma-70 factor (ECF subfamily)